MPWGVGLGPAHARAPTGILLRVHGVDLGEVLLGDRRRRSFMLGVRSPSSMVRSLSRMVNFLIVSQRLRPSLSGRRSPARGRGLVEGDDLAVGLAASPLAAAQRRDGVGVEGDERRRVVVPRAVHEELADERAQALEQGLDLGWARCTCRPRS